MIYTYNNKYNIIYNNCGMQLLILLNFPHLFFCTFWKHQSRTLFTDQNTWSEHSSAIIRFNLKFLEIFVVLKDFLIFSLSSRWSHNEVRFRISSDNNNNRILFQSNFSSDLMDVFQKLGLSEELIDIRILNCNCRD